MRRASLRFGTGAPNGFDEPSILCSVSRRRYKGGPGGGQIPERLPVDAGGNRRAHPLRRVGGSLPANLRQQARQARGRGLSVRPDWSSRARRRGTTPARLYRLNRWPPTQSRCWRSHSDSAQLPPQRLRPSLECTRRRTRRSSGRVCWPPVSGSARSCPGRHVRAVRWTRRRTGACSRSGTARCPTRSCWTAIRFARQRRCNVTIRDLVRQVLRHRTEHVVAGEVGGAVARRPCAGVQQPGTRLPRHRAREPRRSGALAPADLRDAGDDALTLAVVCRGVVDRIDRTDPSRERSGPDSARLVGLRAARGWIGCDRDRVRRPASPNRIQTPKKLMFLEGRTETTFRTLTAWAESQRPSRSAHCTRATRQREHPHPPTAATRAKKVTDARGFGVSANRPPPQAAPGAIHARDCTFRRRRTVIP